MTKIHRNSKVQHLVNTVDESELPNQAITVVAWSSKRHVVLPYAEGRLCIFCWLTPDTFHRVLLSVKLEAILFGTHILVFLEGVLTRRLLSTPTMYKTSTSWDEDRTLAQLVMVHFTCPVISSVSCYCTVSTFYLLSQSVLKMEYLHFFSRELHVEICSRRCLFHLIYVEPTHQT